jgi:N-acetylmuramoyl-L-alanine amidase
MSCEPAANLNSEGVKNAIEQLRIFGRDRTSSQVMRNAVALVLLNATVVAAAGPGWDGTAERAPQAGPERQFALAMSSWLKISGLSYEKPQAYPVRSEEFRATPQPLREPRVASEEVPEAGLPLTRVLGLRVRRIVIDAGHGGYDDGTVGAHGVREKDAVLDVALRTAGLVRRLTGMEVVLTGEDDRFVSLARRTAFANEREADLFLSIHANASPRRLSSGPETYFLNFNGTRSVLEVAARENSGGGGAIGSLPELLRLIARNDRTEESESVARTLQASLFQQAARFQAGSKDRGTKRAPFVVLTGAAMPAALVEIGFLSNWNDEYRLGLPEYRQKLAEALAEGLWRYAESVSRGVAGRQVRCRSCSSGE